MLVKELARALGADGIRVNAIAPGAIPGGGFDADTATLEKMIPPGRTGTPDDIADMAVALLSDRFSRYVTGTTVAVDGGLSLYNRIPLAVTRFQTIAVSKRIPSCHRRNHRLRLPPMRASIRDIVVAIASGTIVYSLVHTIADEGETSPYYERPHISPLERLHRLRGLLSA
jgi:hypothetical protein